MCGKGQVIQVIGDILCENVSMFVLMNVTN